MEVWDCAADLKLEAVFEGVEIGLVMERLGEALGLWHTQQSGKSLAMATIASLQIDDRELPPGSLGIAIDSHLPAQWPSLAFAVQWRFRYLTIRIEQGQHSIYATLESRGNDIGRGGRGA